jgi:hypothetical protein
VSVRRVRGSSPTRRSVAAVRRERCLLYCRPSVSPRPGPNHAAYLPECHPHGTDGGSVPQQGSVRDSPSSPVAAGGEKYQTPRSSGSSRPWQPAARSSSITVRLRLPKGNGASSPFRKRTMSIRPGWTVIPSRSAQGHDLGGRPNRSPRLRIQGFHCSPSAVIHSQPERCGHQRERGLVIRLVRIRRGTATTGP